MLFSSTRKFKFFNNLPSWVVHNNQLVGYDTVNDALFFVGTYCEDWTCSMQLSFATAFAFWAIKNFVNIRSFAATFKLIHAWSTTETPASLYSWWFRVVSTITHLSNWVIFLAPVTSNQIEVGPDLPIDFFPADPVGFSYKSYELLKIPIPVNNVFRSHLTVRINTLESVTTSKNFSLLFSEKLGTVCTFMQLILIFFKE